MVSLAVSVTLLVYMCTAIGDDMKISYTRRGANDFVLRTRRERERESVSTPNKVFTIAIQCQHLVHRARVVIPDPPDHIS